MVYRFRRWIFNACVGYHKTEHHVVDLALSDGEKTADRSDAILFTLSESNSREVLIERGIGLFEMQNMRV